MRSASLASIGCRLLLAGHWRGALAETILEAPRERLQVRHTARADLTAALGLLGPLVRTDLRCRIAASRAPLLLEVEGALATTDTEAVGLFVTLTHGRSAVAATWQAGHHVPM